jgi:hypothetical protein
MKADNDDKRLEELIHGALGRDRLVFDFPRWRQEHQRQVEEYHAQTQPARPPTPSRIEMWKIAAAMILAAGLTVGVLRTIQRTPAPRAGASSATDTAQEPPAPEGLSAQILTVRKMAAAGDVKGLTTVLSEGPLESKLVAANLLAKMAPMPALETVSMHAVGELRVDRQKGKLRLYSTRYPDWLELADSRLFVHSGTARQEATLVRLTIDREGEEQLRQARQVEWESLRKERTDLEKRLARATGVPSDVNQLRERIEKYSEILDLMDGALYASPAHGGLRLEDRVYHREASLLPSDSGVRAEWHGEIVDANSITLLLGLAPVRTGGPATPSPGWRSRFDAVYSLAEGETLRWVRTPFIPERQYYTQELHYYFGTDNPPPPLYMSFRWDGTLHQGALAMHECVLGSVLTEFGLNRYEWTGPAELMALRLGGDWITRTNTSLEQRFDALERILEREVGRRIQFVRKDVEREVIVVRGQYEKRALEGHAVTEPIHLIAGGTPEQATIRGHESLAQILNLVANRFNRPMILETEGLERISVDYQAWLSYDTWEARKLEPEGPFPSPGEEKLNPVLINLAKQTGLEFSREARPFSTWFITEVKGPDAVKTSTPFP